MVRVCLGCREKFETKYNNQYCSRCVNDGVVFKCADCGVLSTIPYKLHKSRMSYQCYSSESRSLRCPTCAAKYPSSLMDESWHTYGCLTVLRLGEMLVDGRARWLCKCECGWYGEVDGASLRKIGNERKCSHANRHIGKKFGDLTIQEAVSGGYIAVCVCGTTTRRTLHWLEQNYDYICNHKKVDVEDIGSRSGLLCVQ